MDFITLIIIIVVSILIIAIITVLTILLLRKNRIYAYIITDAQNIERVTLKKNASTFEHNENEYLFDHKKVYKSKRGKIIYYFEGDANPQDFSRNNKQISASELKKIMKSNILQRLLQSDESEENLKKGLNILSVVLSIVVLIIVIVKNPAVELIDSPVNRQLIMEACKSAFN